MTWTLTSPLRGARVVRRNNLTTQPKLAAQPAAPPVVAESQAPLPTLRDWLGVLAMVVG